MYTDRVNRKTEIKWDSLVKFQKYLSGIFQPNIVTLSAENIKQELMEFNLLFGKAINLYQIYELDSEVYKNITKLIKHREIKDLARKIKVKNDNILNMDLALESFNLFNFDFCGGANPEIISRCIKLVKKSTSSRAGILFTFSTRVKSPLNSFKYIFDPIVNIYLPFYKLKLIDVYSPVTYKDTSSMMYFGLIIENEEKAKNLLKVHAGEFKAVRNIIVENGNYVENKLIEKKLNWHPQKVYNITKLMKNLQMVEKYYNKINLTPAGLEFF